ncbi:MAG: hypothetical protein RAO92_08835 [Candidatus Euphemobacter frigidus]|nr:hypothetical protein [Candidatus Euphemobacter frigidus]MDP8276491.1 hypothetical protein [Candidatus Euphemobacter frigidus]
MKKCLSVSVLVFFLCLPGLGAEDVEPVDSSVTIGGELWGRYLHLDLNHWKDAAGEPLPKQDLFYYGGKVVVCGPLADRTLRWRFGGCLGAAGNNDYDIDEVHLGMLTGGLTSGLSWRPGTVGLSLDLSAGGSTITTEIKRAEEERDWDLYERRDVALFYWEPLLSLDIQVFDICVLRLQGGYTFLYGKGKEVGGVTGGIACDLGRWI